MSWIYIFAIVIPAVKAVLLFAIWKSPRWLYLVFALSFAFCFLFFLALTLGTYFNLGFLSHLSSTVEPQPLFFIAAFNIFSASVFAYLAFLREGLFHISAVKLYIPLQALFSWTLLFPSWPNLPLALIVSSLVLFFALLWWGHLVGHRFWVYFLTTGAVVGLLVWLILEMFIPQGVGYAGAGMLYLLSVVFAHLGLGFLAGQAVITLSIRKRHTKNGFLAPLGILTAFSVPFIFWTIWGAHHPPLRIPLMVVGLFLLGVGALLSGSRRNQHSTPIFTLLCNFGLVSLGLAAGGAEGYLGAVLVMMGMLLTKLPQAIAVFYGVDAAGEKFNYDLEGLGEAMPRMQKVLRFADAAEAGLPPFPGFFGRLLIIIACVKAFHFSVALVAAVLALAIFGLLLNMEMRTYRGKPTLDVSSINDIGRLQVILLASTIIILFIFGLLSPWLIDGLGSVVVSRFAGM